MNSDDQARNLREYNRKIFPVWSGIVKKWEETFSPDPGTPVSESELSVVHRIDNAIRKTGDRIDRGINRGQADAARNRESDMDKLRRVARGYPND